MVDMPAIASRLPPRRGPRPAVQRRRCERPPTTARRTPRAPPPPCLGGWLARERRAPASAARRRAGGRAGRARPARRGRLPGAAVGLLHRHQQPRAGDAVQRRSLSSCPATSKLYSSDYVSGVSASTLTRRAPAHAARSLAALGRQRGRADPQPRTGTARMRRCAVNRPIVRLYGLVVVLFALLVAFTSRWTIFEASSLREQPAQRARAARAAAHRPRARSSPPTARCSRAACAARGRHLRTHLSDGRRVRARGRLLLHSTSARPGSSAIRNAALNGQTRHEPADDPRPAAGQEAAGRQGRHDARPAAPSGSPIAALGGHQGAVVALDPRTGAVKVMASTPSFDPNALRSRRAYAKLTQRHAGQAARQPRHPVRLRPGLDVQGRDRHGGDRHGHVHARIDARAGATTCRSPACRCRTTTTRASARSRSPRRSRKSVNTVWAQVAEQLGKRTMARYMNRFGFDRKPQLDYPAEEMSVQRRVPRRDAAIAPTSPRVDVGRMGIGQDKLEVTPLQMAEVAAAVANHGRLMVAAPDRADRRPRRAHRANGSPRACSRS